MSVTTPLLATIDSPADLRRLPADRLPLLAAELRRRIIDTVSRNGGHLAPSLGVVELTIALHYVFQTPDDRIVWDVGHQTYAHKLLTGRRDRFDTLRQHGGISGFPKREESPYDVFDTGHSSTSISASLGIAAAKCLQRDKDRVIAVIGDGSMTGGMAFEGLNHAGDLHKNLIVVLNDNEMSISPNVGALSSFLSRKLTSKTMMSIKKDMEHFLKSFHNVGENILHLLKRTEESLKGFFTPGMLFEALKFEYVGPLPGHNLDSLIETFRNVRQFSDGPVLIHVLTTKGKGYPPAEKNPGDYHGLGPFDAATGVPVKPERPQPASYTEVFGDTLVRLAEKDKRVTAITAAMPAGTGLSKFAARFPTRCFDVGIAEQHAVTFAAGLALEGMRPVVAIYSTFLQRALDQIIHDVCLQGLPVTFAIDRGGLVGDDGPTHHGVFDLSFLRFIPGLLLMAPKDEAELQDMLFTAIQQDGPCAIRYPRGCGDGVPLRDEFRLLPVGRGELLREGDDVLLLGVGNRVTVAMEAAAGLEKIGIDAAVINPRFIQPLDGELICRWAEKTGRVITVEENAARGGFGSALLEELGQRDLLRRVVVRSLGIPARFIEHGPQDILRKQCRIDSAAVIQAAMEITARTQLP
ncbi:MAG: 1-deoxy-D-xylulose-5-phosphate synthase [Thermodesulfobacteriota bacterium]